VIVHLTGTRTEKWPDQRTGTGTRIEISKIEKNKNMNLLWKDTEIGDPNNSKHYEALRAI